MSIKEEVKKYNESREEFEKAIPAKAIENAEKIEKLFKENDISGYDIVCSPLGSIYFEWTGSNFSMGVAVDKTENISFEHFISITHEGLIEVYNMNDEDEMFDLITIIKDVLISDEEVKREALDD